MQQNNDDGDACIAIDFETSGYYGSSACALGMARIENNEIVGQYYTLIRPPSSRVYFTHIHGLSWQDLKTAKSFAEIWPDAVEFMAGAGFLIAHNASFDRKVMMACCDAFGLPVPVQPFLCTLKGARKGRLPLKSRSLSNVCAYFGLELDHHHAGSDALGCAGIYINLIKLGLPRQMMLL